MARLLVYTATFGEGPRPETVASVAAQEFDGELVHEISYHNPFPGLRNMANVVAQYQRARQMALDDGYDALLTVEHDMELPAGMVQALWDTPGDVVYGLYMLRHGTNVISLWRHEGPKNLGMSMSFYPAEFRRYRQAGYGPVSGVGWGCTLIRRNVLSAIQVRELPGDAGDIPFAQDCLRAGYKILGRFDRACRHYHEGVWLEVGMDHAASTHRVLALADVTVSVNGQPRPLKQGHYYSLPAELAGDLTRAGYVRVTLPEPDPAPAVVEQATDVRAMTRTRRRA